MPKSDLTLTSSGDYAPVAARIALFYERYPAGRVITDLIARSDGEVLFKASVYRSADETEPAATGWALEREGDGEVNEVACLENTETSAIGRALANLGFTASTKRPSREEMEKVARASRASGTRGVGAAGATARPRISDAKHAARRDGLQDAADAASDALDLLRSAERLGLSAARARVFRQTVLDGVPDDEILGRCTRLLREWIRRRSTRRLYGGETPDSGSGRPG